MKNLYNALLLKQLYQLKVLGYRYTDKNSFCNEEKNSIEFPNSLEALKKEALTCHLCSLSKNRKHVVFGSGSKEAQIMFIGDVPLDLEDEMGKPFLGRAGEMLTAMIENVLKISKENVYLTNLVKCKPSRVEELHETAFHTCKSYLFKEIELVQPTVIITLGEKAYHYLTNDTTPLQEIRGTVLQKENYTIVPTYHPNFLLRNPSLKKEVFLDLKTVKELL